MSIANDLTAQFLIEAPKRIPGLRLWRQNTGRGVGSGIVKAAIRLLERGQIKPAINILRTRPINFGVVGGGDMSGVYPSRPCDHPQAVTIGIRVEVEVKVGNDKQSPEQIAFQSMCIETGAVYVVIHELEQGIADLKAELE